jgi:hypothetical protein
MTDHEGDRRVLEALRRYGSDLSKPHHTIHYLYLKSERAACAVAAELQRDGYTKIDVHRAPTPWWKRLLGKSTWSCIAETHAIPSEQGVFATSDRMTALAASHGGIYDGWEAGIVKG